MEACFQLKKNEIEKVIANVFLATQNWNCIAYDYILISDNSRHFS